jgi:hypothetical protein
VGQPTCAVRKSGTLFRVVSRDRIFENGTFFRRFSMNGWPERIADEEALEELLSRPTAEVVEMMRRVDGDMMFLGAFGKIGPTLTWMARRATEQAGVPRRIYAVGRHVSPQRRQWCLDRGIEPICCDLLDRSQLAELPEVPNIFYLAAMKFGTTGREPFTWALNSFLPGLVCERFSRSRIVAFSTGNVYPLVPVQSGGSKEEDPPEPIGEYAMSCLGRERIFTYFSLTRNIPVVLIRLNYAHEVRYGIMVDLGQKILAGEPIELAMGYFNVIWQGDSNQMTLRALEYAAVPARPINVTGPEVLRVREVAVRLAELLGRPVEFVGQEAPTALLSNACRAYELFGRPQVAADQILGWVADWLRRGGPTLGKPTKFQVRNGRF